MGLQYVSPPVQPVVDTASTCRASPWPGPCLALPALPWYMGIPRTGQSCAQPGTIKLSVAKPDVGWLSAKYHPHPLLLDSVRQAMRPPGPGCHERPSLHLGFPSLPSGGLWLGQNHERLCRVAPLQARACLH